MTSLQQENNPLNSQLFNAIFADDAKQVATLLAAHADANALYNMNQRQTTLHLAAGRKASEANREIIKLLLAAKASVSARDGNKETPMSAAIKYGNAEAVRELLENKVDPNVTCRSHYSPLYWAMLRSPYPETIQLLLDNKASITDDDGEVLSAVINEAVIYSSPGDFHFENYTRVLKQLIPMSGDLNKKNSHGVTPLQQAARGGRVDLMELLLEHKALLNLNETLAEGDTWIHIAADAYSRHNGEKVMAFLIEAKANPNIPNNQQMTPLQQAVKSGNIIAIPALLMAKASVAVADEKGNTPLHQAALNGNLPMVQVLIDGKADVWVKGGGGQTALDLTDRIANPNIATLLNKKMRTSAQVSVFTGLHSRVGPSSPMYSLFHRQRKAIADVQPIGIILAAAGVGLPHAKDATSNDNSQTGPGPRLTRSSED